MGADFFVFLRCLRCGVLRRRSDLRAGVCPACVAKEVHHH